MTEAPDRRMREAAPLFEELSDLPEARAEARLTDLERSDPTLAALLRDLLAAERGAGNFLEQGAFDDVSSTLARDLAGEDPVSSMSAGALIGPYVLESLLGRGGMGEVWIARRRDGQFEQQVALKLWTGGADFEGVRRRFLQERQVLAGLHHPHIARLFDGGTADLLAEPTAANLREARAELDQAIALIRKVDAEHPRLDEMLLASGRVARLQDDRDRARRDLSEALERLRRHHGDKDARTAEARTALAGIV